MDEIDYKDSGKWPVIADGSGASLSKIAPDMGSKQSENWAASSQPGGTPGNENVSTIPIIPFGLVFNETAPAPNTNFWLEIVNYGTNSLQLNNYHIRCSSFTNDFIFPVLPIAPGQFIVLNAGELGFIPAVGDKLYLYSENAVKILDGIIISEKLQGRNEKGEWLFPQTETQGAPNVFSLHDEIVINEIMYHHQSEYEKTTEELKNFYIPITGMWQYDDSGSDLGDAWRDPSYNDSGWNSGNALLYYDNDPMPAPKNTQIDKGNKTTFSRTI